MAIAFMMYNHISFTYTVFSIWPQSDRNSAKVNCYSQWNEQCKLEDKSPNIKPTYPKEHL